MYGRLFILTKIVIQSHNATQTFNTLHFFFNIGIYKYEPLLYLPRILVPDWPPHHHTEQNRHPWCLNTSQRMLYPHPMEPVGIEKRKCFMLSSNTTTVIILDFFFSFRERVHIIIRIGFSS